MVHNSLLRFSDPTSETQVVFLPDAKGVPVAFRSCDGTSGDDKQYRQISN